MRGRDIIVVGASAGGVEALMKLVRGLPQDLPAAVFVVLHVPPNGTSALPQILSRKGPLPAVHAVDGQPFEHGRIYVAPPDHHLLLQPHSLRLTRGPHENGHRPASNPLFRSAARAHGRYVSAVILSGSLDDGTEGLQVVKHAGGLAMVQDPADALFPSMPKSALAHVAVDVRLPAAQLGAVLDRASREPPSNATGLAVEAAMNERSEIDPDLIEPPVPSQHDERLRDQRSAFTCPHCHGTLWEAEEHGLLRFRCRTGHAFGAESLNELQAEDVESALWTALRALQERAALTRRLERRAIESGHRASQARFGEQTRSAERGIAALSKLLNGARQRDLA